MAASPSGFYTTRGAAFRDNAFFNRSVSLPTEFRVHFVTEDGLSVNEATRLGELKATKTLGQRTELATGNGYDGLGIQLLPNLTNFPAASEDDVNFWSEIALTDWIVTAASGQIPASGLPPRYLFLVSDETPKTNRQVIFVVDMGDGVAASDGQPIGQQNSKMRTTV